MNELARQAQLQLMVHPDLVAGRQASAVSGRLTPRQALDHLLVGSGLVADIQGSDVIVRRASARHDEERTVGSLREVRVQARRLGETEGPGSYASDGLTVGKTAQAMRGLPQSVTVLTSPDGHLDADPARQLLMWYVQEGSARGPSSARCSPRSVPVRQAQGIHGFLLRDVKGRAIIAAISCKYLQ